MPKVKDRPAEAAAAREKDAKPLCRRTCELLAEVVEQGIDGLVDSDLLSKRQCLQVVAKVIRRAAEELSLPSVDALEPEAKEAKVRHVKAAGQDRSHVCHWPGCGKQCEPARWGCRACWFKLPKTLRDRIWAAYRIGQEADGKPSREYVKAAREIQEWIRTNHHVED